MSDADLHYVPTWWEDLRLSIARWIAPRGAFIAPRGRIVILGRTITRLRVDGEDTLVVETEEKS